MGSLRGKLFTVGLQVRMRDYTDDVRVFRPSRTLEKVVLEKLEGKAKKVVKVKKVMKVKEVM